MISNRFRVFRLDLIGALLAASVSTGCGSQEVPQAHVGRLFDKTGVLALYAGDKGNVILLPAQGLNTVLQLPTRK